MPSKIMLIRHAEKPHGSDQGVTDKGEPDPESLIVRGWQRAGALVALFDPAEGALQNTNLAVPTVIYASNPVTSSDASGDKAGKKKIGSKSERPLETITPLAKRLNLSPDLSFVEGQEHDLATAVLKASGVVLIVRIR